MDVWQMLTLVAAVAAVVAAVGAVVLVAYSALDRLDPTLECRMARDSRLSDPAQGHDGCRSMMVQLEIVNRGRKWLFMRGGKEWVVGCTASIITSKGEYPLVQERQQWVTDSSWRVNGRVGGDLRSVPFPTFDIPAEGKVTLSSRATIDLGQDEQFVAVKIDCGTFTTTQQVPIPKEQA